MVDMLRSAQRSTQYLLEYLIFNWLYLITISITMLPSGWHLASSVSKACAASSQVCGFKLHFGQFIEQLFIEHRSVELS